MNNLLTKGQSHPEGWMSDKFKVESLDKIFTKDIKGQKYTINFKNSCNNYGEYDMRKKGQTQYQ